VSPEATVETSSFGTPTGSARIAWAAIAELRGHSRTIGGAWVPAMDPGAK